MTTDFALKLRHRAAELGVITPEEEARSITALKKKEVEGALDRSVRGSRSGPGLRVESDCRHREGEGTGRDRGLGPTGGDQKGGHREA